MILFTLPLPERFRPVNLLWRSLLASQLTKSSLTLSYYYYPTNYIFINLHNFNCNFNSVYQALHHKHIKLYQSPRQKPFLTIVLTSCYFSLFFFSFKCDYWSHLMRNIFQRTQNWNSNSMMICQ